MSLQSQLKNINLRTLKYKNTNLTYTQILHSEAKRFANLLQKYLDEFYDSYREPVIYNRTYSLYNSIYIDDLIDIDFNGNQLTINIKRDEGSYHDSWFTEGKTVDTFWLYNDGFQTEKPSWRDVEYWGWRDGFGYMDKAINEFQKGNKYNLTLQVHRPLKYFT